MHSINTQYKLHFSRVVCPNKILKDCKTLTWEILKYIKVSQNLQRCREGCSLPVLTKFFCKECVVCLTSTYRKLQSGLLARHCVWWFSVVRGVCLSWWCSVRSKWNNKLKCSPQRLFSELHVSCGRSESTCGASRSGEAEWWSLKEATFQWDRFWIRFRSQTN